MFKWFRRKPPPRPPSIPYAREDRKKYLHDAYKVLDIAQRRLDDAVVSLDSWSQHVLNDKRHEHDELLAPAHLVPVKAAVEADIIALRIAIEDMRGALAGLEYFLYARW